MKPECVQRIEYEVTLLVRRAEAARKEHEGSGEGLDRAAYLLLGELDQRGPLGIAALAQAFQVDISTASRQTTVLETKGLVKRRPDPTDGRVSLLEITPGGRRQYRAARTGRQALFGTLLDGWTAEECRQFAASLARLNQAIEQGMARQWAVAPTATGVPCPEP